MFNKFNESNAKLSKRNWIITLDSINLLKTFWISSDFFIFVWEKAIKVCYFVLCIYAILSSDLSVSSNQLKKLNFELTSFQVNFALKISKKFSTKDSNKSNPSGSFNKLQKFSRPSFKVFHNFLIQLKFLFFNRNFYVHAFSNLTNFHVQSSLLQFTLDTLNTQKLKHLVRSNKFVHPLDLLTLFRQKSLYNSNTQKLEHFDKSNKHVGPLNEFLSISQTFSYLAFQ